MTYWDDIGKIWQSVMDSFRDTMPKTAIELWFEDLFLAAFDGTTLVFESKSELKHKIIKERYVGLMEERFERFLGFPVKIDLRFTGIRLDNEAILRQIRIEEVERNQRAAGIPEGTPVIGSTIPPFNFEYTFENFIIGESNKFAQAACLAVARAPARDYNPLFIYGHSGIGKTHLLYAITNEIRKRQPDVNVIYVKCEDFTNQMIESLSRQAMSEFREKYRNCDVLLIDDIQFIAGKISTQEEFFYTFNALFESSKQVILASDRPPREIRPLEERLRTRFEWGLIADIQPPDLELRIAIIKKKAEQVKLDLPEDILTFIAENLRSNVRQIEGAIKKLGAHHFLSGREITMELARECLSELLGGDEPISVTVDKIFSTIYNHYNVDKGSLLSTKRTKEIAAARHVCIYLIREVTEMSYPNIGKIFGRDHSTILSSIDIVEKKRMRDPLFDIEMGEMLKDITGK